MNINLHFDKRGFTLVELLIIIGVIGVLAGVILVLINPIRQFERARDAGRKNDLKQLQTALELFYLRNGRYPHLGSGYADYCDDNSGFDVWNQGGIRCASTPGFLNILVEQKELKKMLKDPRQSGATCVPVTEVANCFQYAYISDINYGCGGDCYVLVTRLEDETDPDLLSNSCGSKWDPRCYERSCYCLTSAVKTPPDF